MQSRARLRQLRLQWHVLTRNRLQKLAVIFIGILLFLAIFSPYIVPHPDAISGAVHAKDTLAAPSWSHPFGTDEMGRDIFSRVLYGARISVTAGLVTVGLSCADRRDSWRHRGRIRRHRRRGHHALRRHHALLPHRDPGHRHRRLLGRQPADGRPRPGDQLVAVLRETRPRSRRLGARASVRACRRVHRDLEIVQIFRHILPGSIGPMLVSASLDIGYVILSLAALSFLGVGAQPPSPEWGLMITQSRTYFMQAWWYMAFPGIAITLTVLAFNLLGDGLGEVLNPKTRGRGVSTTPDHHLRIRNLKVGFEIFDGFVDVLNVGELTLRAGESYGLVGESGAGKTVLALAVLGLLRQPPARVEADECSLEGEDILRKSQKELREMRGRRIAMIFQDPMSSLDPVFTAGQQLSEVLRRREGLTKQPGSRPGPGVPATGGASRSDDVAGQVSASALGRTAAARDHRSGAGLRSAPAHRR